MILHVADNNHCVHEDAGDLYFLRIERAGCNHAFYLCDHGTAGVLARLRHDQRFCLNAQMLHGDIAVFIGICAGNDSEVDRLVFIEEILFAADLHQLHQIFLLAGQLVQLAAH